MAAILHRCSVCGNQDEWGPAWLWFGSYADLEEGKPILKVCGEECRKKLGKSGKVDFGHGEIISRAEYAVSCGGCGTEEELNSRRESSAYAIGWSKHAEHGWLCPSCSTHAALYDEVERE